MGYLRLYAYLVISFTFCLACRQNNKEDKDVAEIYNSLKDNEAQILFKIDGKEFYTSKSIFKGETTISKSTFSMKLADQFEDKTMINFEEEDWYTQSPIKREVFGNDQVGVSMKTGRIVDPVKMIGEGYVLAQGEIIATEFLRDKMIFKVSGKVGKYSDFMEPEKYLPIDGWIIYKKPVIKYERITEKEIFSSMKLNR